MPLGCIKLFVPGNIWIETAALQRLAPGNPSEQPKLNEGWQKGEPRVRTGTFTSCKNSAWKARSHTELGDTAGFAARLKKKPNKTTPATAIVQLNEVTLGKEQLERSTPCAPCPEQPYPYTQSRPLTAEPLQSPARSTGLLRGPRRSIPRRNPACSL